jgi:hypothetical protein
VGALKGESAMDHAAIEPAIKIILTEIHSKLNEAARIAKAAEACALAGSVAECESAPKRDPNSDDCNALM